MTAFEFPEASFPGADDPTIALAPTMAAENLQRYREARARLPPGKDTALVLGYLDALEAEAKRLETRLEATRAGAGENAVKVLEKERQAQGMWEAASEALRERDLLLKEARDHIQDCTPDAHRARVVDLVWRINQVIVRSPPKAMNRPGVGTPASTPPALYRPGLPPERKGDGYTIRYE